MSSLSAEVLKGELRERIVQLGHLVDELERIYPAPATRPVPVDTRVGREEKGAMLAPTNGTKRSGGYATVRSADGKSKVCHNCGNMRPLEAYTQNKNCKDGFAWTCKVCKKNRVGRNATLFADRSADLSVRKPRPA
jgi:hypothetical protein